jgi:RND superfamily putative drug exporter
VLVILLLIYRSPVFLPVLVSAGLALVMAQAVVYLLARDGVLTVDGQSQGILSVLVLGAGTDYALLLISRFKEELHREDSWSVAMHRALAGSVPPSSPQAPRSSSACCACCCPTSTATSRSARSGDRHRRRGPRHDGLPAGTAHGLRPVLVLPVRAAPRRRRLPRQGGLGPGRPAGRPAPAGVWITTSLVLAFAALFTTQLEADGLSTAEQFTTEVDSVQGQEVLARHFPAGTGVPVSVIGAADEGDRLLELVSGVPGVAQAALTPASPGPPGAAPAQAGPPKVVEDKVQVQALLDVASTARRRRTPCCGCARRWTRSGTTCWSAAGPRSSTTSSRSRPATAGSSSRPSWW